jgi:hypothetical protein
VIDCTKNKPIPFMIPTRRWWVLLLIIHSENQTCTNVSLGATNHCFWIYTSNIMRVSEQIISFNYSLGSNIDFWHIHIHYRLELLLLLAHVMYILLKYTVSKKMIAFGSFQQRTFEHYITMRHLHHIYKCRLYTHE